MPCSWLFQYWPVKARSVPCFRATRYCSGVRSFCHSASVLVIFSMGMLVVVVASDEPAALLVASCDRPQPASRTATDSVTKGFTDFISRPFCYSVPHQRNISRSGWTPLIARHSVLRHRAGLRQGARTRDVQADAINARQRGKIKGPAAGVAPGDVVRM